MDADAVERFREMFTAGMSQYDLKPADLADHRHSAGRMIPRFNDSRMVDCLCRGVGTERKRSVTKQYEHAFESGRPLSADWAYRVLCMLHAAKKVAAWRAARDPGQDDWLWDMDNARLREPWGNPDPMVRDGDLPPIAIPHKYAAEQLAREMAHELANAKNALGASYIRRVDEDGVAVLLRQFFDANQKEMAISFASWYGAAVHQYRVVVNDSKLEKIQMLVREGRKSKVHEVRTGGDPYEIHFSWSREAPEGDRPPDAAGSMYAFLTRDLEQEARGHHRG
jgi:hypothetical protein